MERIQETNISKRAGNKAENLHFLWAQGFLVPKGYILFPEELEEVEKELSEVEKELSRSEKGQISVLETLFEQLDLDREYAVRSSGLKEDSGDFSFAGTYESILNVKGKEDIVKAINICYASRHSKENIAYCKQNEIDPSSLEMAVIVQEMIAADYSGIAFTINPVTGIDTQIIVELVKGVGDVNADGRANPERYVYDWFQGIFIEKKVPGMLSQDLLMELMENLLKIQKAYGYPVDVEFAVKDEILYFIQARQITKILFSEISDQWTTANFKDGGVSCKACYPLLWSLYEYTYEGVGNYYYPKLGVYKSGKIRKQIDCFFSRPYWNVEVCKEALMKLPGFVEIDYDNEMGLKIPYEGRGRTSKKSLKILMNLPKIIMNYSNMVKEQKIKVDDYHKGQLKKYVYYRDLEFENMSPDQFKKLWKKLITEEYFYDEVGYFWQVFLNITVQSMFKEKMMKYENYQEYLTLLSGIENVAHTRPFQKEKIIIKEIRNDAVSNEYWTGQEIQNIETLLKEGSEEFKFPLIRDYLKEYGYHAERELDLTAPSYYDNPEPLLVRIKENIKKEDYESRFMGADKAAQRYHEGMENLKEKVSKHIYKKLEKDTLQMRELLWWREELKDMSIRFYYLIKRYTNHLAQLLLSEGIIPLESDIHYFKMAELIDYIDGKCDKETMTRYLSRNRSYYESFKNFNNPSEIGQMYKEGNHKSAYTNNADKSNVNKNNKIYKGNGASSGVVKGIARVVTEEEIVSIQKDEILVTEYIDTGLIGRFPMFGGVVSEYGGTLCHSSIIAREYGIPAIVGVKDITKLIKTGDIIILDGAAGTIEKVGEKDRYRD